jgi:hypothetical protein
MEALKEYKSIEETTETLISFIFINKSYHVVLNTLQDNLDKASKITNIVKKNKINNRFYSLLKYIENNYVEESILNSIFLVGDKIFEYKLNQKEIKTSEEYNFQKIFIKCDTFFYVDYMIDLFYNFTFIYGLKITKNDLYVFQLNKNKEKEVNSYKNINENRIYEEIDNIRKNYNYKDIIILYGNSSLLGKLNHKSEKMIIEKEKSYREDIYNIYQSEIIKNNNLLLEKKLLDLQNPNTNTDLYIFGKLKEGIKEAIEMYMVKELYIEEKKLERLRKIVDHSFLNFKIIEIKSIQDGDSAYHFIKDYNGIMAIKYY